MKPLIHNAAGLLLTALLLANVSLPALAADAPAQATHEFKLTNGLKLIVREDHRAPVVVSPLLYQVRSHS